MKKGSTTTTIHYVGRHFEKETGGASPEYRSHAWVNGQRFYTQFENSSNLVSYYNLRDHLGSADKQAFAGGDGSDLYQYSFDAFGKRRNPNWTPDNNDAQQTATRFNHRGYTDHEHLDNVRLIHMGGRVYDPKLGRFLSVDPLLGDLSQPQSLNTYSYVMNNPLAYTDPSGFSPHLPFPMDEGPCQGDPNCIAVIVRGVTVLVGNRGVSEQVGQMIDLNIAGAEAFFGRVQQGFVRLAQSLIPGTRQPARSQSADTGSPAPQEPQPDKTGSDDTGRVAAGVIGFVAGRGLDAAGDWSVDSPFPTERSGLPFEPSKIRAIGTLGISLYFEHMAESAPAGRGRGLYELGAALMSGASAIESGLLTGVSLLTVPVFVSAGQPWLATAALVGAGGFGTLTVLNAQSAIQYSDRAYGNLVGP